MAIQDREGNVLYPPSRSQKAKVGGEEILASYARFTQRGCTLVMNATAGPNSDGVLPAGTYLAKQGKKYVKYTASGADTNEAQTVTVTGTPTGGALKLTFSAQQTADIPFNSIASVVQAALEALSNINPGDVVVTGGPGPGTPWVVTFAGQYQNTDVPQMTVSNTFTGGSSPAAAVTTTQVPSTGKCLGVLRNSVDVSLGDKLGNIVTSGILKASVVANANGATTVLQAVIDGLNGRVDVESDQFII